MTYLMFRKNYYEKIGILDAALRHQVDSISSTHEVGGRLEAGCYADGAVMLHTKDNLLVALQPKDKGYPMLDKEKDGTDKGAILFVFLFVSFCLLFSGLSGTFNRAFARGLVNRFRYLGQPFSVCRSTEFGMSVNRFRYLGQPFSVSIFEPQFCLFAPFSIMVREEFCLFAHLSLSVQGIGGCYDKAEKIRVGEILPGIIY